MRGHWASYCGPVSQPMRSSLDYKRPTSCSRTRVMREDLQLGTPRRRVYDSLLDLS